MKLSGGGSLDGRILTVVLFHEGLLCEGDMICACLQEPDCTGNWRVTWWLKTSSRNTGIRKATQRLPAEPSFTTSQTRSPQRIVSLHTDFCRHQTYCYSPFLLTLDVFTAFNKICCRCGAEYKVNANGNCVRKEECSFHWGPLRRHKGLGFSVFFFCFYSTPVANRSRMLISTISPCSCPCPIVAGGWETSYRCCAAAVGAPGCQVSKVLYPPSPPDVLRRL